MTATRCLGSRVHIHGVPSGDAALHDAADDGGIGEHDGGVCEELAAGVAPMTNHHEEPAPLPALVWAVVFTILLVAAVAVFALVLSR